jgi:molecular chaperone HscB
MTDFFELFDIKEDYQIDYATLDEKYFTLQKKYHPDNYTGSSDKERRNAIEYSMVINKAYNVLKSPLKRAEYILLQRDIVVNTDTADTIRPEIELLEQVMEDKEQLFAITNKEQLINFEQQKFVEKNMLIDALSKDFAREDFDNAAIKTINLRYLNKLLEDLKIKKSNIK